MRIVIIHNQKRKKRGKKEGGREAKEEKISKRKQTG